MRRGALAAVAASLLALLLAPVAGASHDPTGAPFKEDFATGVGSSQDFEFDFTARSGPSGENPTGHISAEVFGLHRLEGQVTCLKVTGNTATFGFTQDSNPIFGPFGRVTVVDNDPQGTDTIAGETTSIPGDCSTPTTTLQQFVGSGDIVVHDAPALPTSKDQCRSGGWRNFPGFRNQGECVAFVERHPQP